jgi:rubrerythrin
MTTTLHPGKCKFCGYVLQLDIDDACPVQQLKSWIGLAACNRCADFRMNCLLIGDRCNIVLGKLHNAAGTKKEKDVRDLAVVRLTDMTKNLMRVICQHYKVETYWEKTIVDELLDHPAKLRVIFAHMIRQVGEYAKKSEKPHQATFDNENDAIQSMED